jgi:glucose/mannose-6-phosphate isomerase
MNLDPNNLRKIIKEFPTQVNYILDQYKDIHIETSDIDRVLLSGMGGSAFPGDIINDYLSCETKIDINRRYKIPKYVSKETLIIASSYSGNTEESISALNDAITKKYQICVITAGGQLAQIAKEKNLPLILIPSGLPPRTASGYFFAAIILIMEKLGIVDNQSDKLRSIEDFLIKTDIEEDAKEIAARLKGKLPIVYSSESYESLAKIWKIKFNEHSKQQAFYNVFPELNHNELIGWTTLVTDSIIILLRSENNCARIKKRMDITKSILEEKGILVIEVNLKGNSKLEELFFGLYLGDFVAYYLAIENNIDPFPVDLVEAFKQRLEE